MRKKREPSGRPSMAFNMIQNLSVAQLPKFRARLLHNDFKKLKRAFGLCLRSSSSGPSSLPRPGLTPAQSHINYVSVDDWFILRHFGFLKSVVI
jgi:hypothetical protein